MVNVLQIVNPVDLIDKDIFELLKIENAPEATKQKIMSDMMASIQTRVLARLMDNLSEEEAKEFDGIIDLNDDAKTIEFLKSKDIDLQKITAEEALYYKTELYQLVTGKKDDSSNKEE